MTNKKLSLLGDEILISNLNKGCHFGGKGCDLSLISVAGRTL